MLVLAISSLTSVALFLIGAANYDTGIFGFLNWNLFLAWLPLLLVIGLKKFLKTNPWLSWQAIGLTALWLAFLPNTFYIISDLIHVNSLNSSNSLFYAVMIFSFSFNGLILGFISIYLIHRELIKRLPKNYAHLVVAIVILLCSFAIYLGRYLRWSTWDVVVNPAGVIFDVSDRFINPVAHGRTFEVTALFFVLIGSMYFVLWNIVETIKNQKDV